MRGWPMVTVVVPTYNRADMLKGCLVSLESLSYPRDCYEIVVVDDGSQDGTPIVLNEFKNNTCTTFKFIRQENKGPAAARNRAIEQAHGDFIAFMDDDCVAVKNWLSALVEGFESEKIGGVGGTVRVGSRGLISDYMSLNNIVASNIKGDRVPPFLITANACFRANLLTKVGGFDEHIKHPGGEDPDLSWRIAALGFSLTINPEAIVYHHHTSSLMSIIQSNYHYGQGHRYLELKHGLSRGSRSLCQDLLHILSMRSFLFRAKQYAVVHCLGWCKGFTFSLLDRIRELAWLRGYYRQCR